MKTWKVLVEVRPGWTLTGHVGAVDAEAARVGTAQIAKSLIAGYSEEMAIDVSVLRTPILQKDESLLINAQSLMATVRALLHPDHPIYDGISREAHNLLLVAYREAATLLADIEALRSQLKWEGRQ